ncbi:hypothetical protein Pan258_07830 [Symmachiella dynata]|uniref:type I restriction endonuclease n=1 Tax=Symmachiella dynata TaxID=2527995 RepID=UPI00118CAB0E|nr:type I restriction endonuclease [Symmachiella dynata]QDT46763.1 hypothetical protein Pan258_07830 [Symmachiella dynata]
MDLIDQVREISSRLPLISDKLETEEATKNALIMPFINALGYNVFDPTEVVPEFHADVGTKRGEKVDYSIMLDGNPIILFECKKAGSELAVGQASQLYRYFSVTDARFGVLTDGINYKFFSDLESQNKMDSLPFFEFDIREISDDSVNQLKRFSKSAFDLDGILSTATDLKFTKAIRRVLSEEWLNPTEDFVRLFASRVYSGKLTQNVREQFTSITKKALHEFVSERVNQRLKNALKGDVPDEGPEIESTVNDGNSEVEVNGGNGIVTTEDEIEGFYVVKSILCEVINPTRIFMRDTLSYCGILLDDNNRKPICRLLFDGSSKKFIAVFDSDKKPIRHEVNDVNDIYKYANELKSIVAMYDSKGDG